MITKKYLTEDFNSSIFDVDMTPAKLQSRKVSLARVLNQAKKALIEAEATGNTSIASRLQERIEYLQELLDRADEAEIDIPDDGYAEDSDDDSDRDGEGGRPIDDDTGGHSGDSADSDDKEGPDGDSGDEGDEEEGSGGDSGDDEDGPSGDTGDDDDSLDGDTGEDKDVPDGEPGKDKDGPEGDSSEDNQDSDKDSKSDSEEGSPDGDPEEGEEGTDDSEDPTEEPDDYPKDMKPTIKDNKVLIDPFKKLPPPDPRFAPPDDMEVESVFDAAKRILSKLTGEHRNGAIQGLKDLLGKKGIVTENLKLQEAIKKTLSQMSDDEFNNELHTTMELVDKVITVDYSDDLEARAKEIKRDMLNPLVRAEMEKEDAEHVKADHAAAKAAEAENAKYTKIKALDGLDKFKATLYRAISDQVEMAEDEVDSWAALDRRHEDEPDIIKKGTLLDDVPDDIPTINVYFDQSGSWSNRDIEIGKRAISVINEFHENGQIKLNILYMSAGGIFTTPEAARAHYQAEGWYAALSDIKSSKVQNVIVLADGDLDYFEWSNRPSGNNGRTFVDGCVWWLWKNGERSKKAPKELIGRRGNFEYSFESY